MYVILPISQYTTRLYCKSELFTHRHNLPNISLETCYTIVRLLLEEQLYNRLHWSHNSDELEELLAREISFWPKDIKFSDRKTLELCREYMQSYIDPIDDELGQLVTEHVGRNDNYDAMWAVWHTLKIGGDIVLEKGQDWRIIEFERRRALGE